MLASLGWGAWGSQRDVRRARTKSSLILVEKSRKPCPEAPHTACWVLHCIQMHKGSMKLETGSSPKLTDIKKRTSCRGAGNRQHLQEH